MAICNLSDNSKLEGGGGRIREKEQLKLKTEGMMKREDDRKETGRKIEKRRYS